MAPAGPALDDGADDEPNEPELDDEPELDEPELDDEPEPEAELLPEDPVLEDPVLEAPVLEDPVPVDAAPELPECPVLAWLDDPLLLLAVLCAAAGSSAITMPATAAPTIPAPMVALRRRRRA